MEQAAIGSLRGACPPAFVRSGTETSTVPKRSLHFGTVEVSVPERTKAGGTQNPFWATIFPIFVVLSGFQRNQAFFFALFFVLFDRF